MIRLALLGSTRGTNIDAIFRAISENKLAAEIKLVLSNKEHAPILNRAKEFGLNAFYLNPEGSSREVYDNQVSLLLTEHAVDLIVLIGYMRILSDPFVQRWEHKIINVHPSLLPAFAGLMDMDVHRAVLKAGCKETGCTVHYVTEQVDAGPIILQRKCEVLDTDTPELLKARVQGLEGETLVEGIRSLSLKMK